LAGQRRQRYRNRVTGSPGEKDTIMRRLTSLPLFVLAASLAGSCATVSGGHHLQRDIDFTAYRTYEWGPPDALPVGDPRLDDSPHFHDYFQGAVERQLRVKGYETATGQPDLLLHYHAAVNQRIDIDKTDRAYGYCQTPNCEPQVIEFEQGTIVLDVVDARTNKVIWRGWAQGSLTGVFDDQDRLDAHVEKDVAKIMSQFPLAGTPVR
jgi:hypothetical protein